MKTFDELREAYRKPTQAEIDADRRKDGKSKDTSSRYKNMKKKVYGNMMGGLKKEENDLDEAVSKVKTTMPDKVASSAIRFGLKSKSQGGSVSISGPKGKLNDFLRAIIGRSSYGNASELDEAKLSDMEIHNKLANRNLLIKAIKTAEKMSGNMTGAVREIEKMKKGLSKHKAVQAALRQANESVDQTDEILEESDTFHVKVGDGRDHMIVKTKAKNSREAVKKIKSQYPKDRVSLYRESLDEAKYNKGAVDKEIKKDRRIKGKEAKAIHSLLKGRTPRKEDVELEEALQHVHTIKIDGNAPNNPKPFEVREIKDDFKTHVQAVRSAIKSKGGLVTDTETPSKSNNYVGWIMVGTRGDASKIDAKSIEKAVKRHGVEIHAYQFESVEDASKLSNSAIQKAVKSKGTEIQNNQFMSESVESLDENYRTLATHGMGAETKNTINVGRDVDYYEPKNGDKRQGRITKVTRSGYVVKDENDGKSHTFAFHDRAKAKEIMAKSK